MYPFGWSSTCPSKSSDIGVWPMATNSAETRDRVASPVFTFFDFDAGDAILGDVEHLATSWLRGS